MSQMLSSVLGMALLMGVSAQKEEPDVYVPWSNPVPGPVLPTETKNEYTVPIGTYLPIAVRKDDKVRTRYSVPGLFLDKVRIEKDGYFGGFAYNEKGLPSNKKFKDTTYVFVAKAPGKTVLTVDANGPEGPIDKLVLSITVLEPGSNPLPSPQPVQDELLEAMKFMYRTESDADKALLPHLKLFYEESVDQVDVATSWSDLFKRMNVLADAHGTSGKLQFVQRVASVELKDKLPWKADDVAKPLDDVGKKKAKEVLTRLATTAAKLN